MHTIRQGDFRFTIFFLQCYITLQFFYSDASEYATAFVWSEKIIIKTNE